ncbi:hypothetical protein [Saccharothrix sp. HUAS TT1]|uniref:hypothetical protein n=1 Tax=unclassified Saccharothrix TaxID=2593673 RepID=UPI00345C38C8
MAVRFPVVRLVVAGVVAVPAALAAAAFAVGGGVATTGPPAFTHPAKAPVRPTVEPVGATAVGAGPALGFQRPRSGGVGRVDVRVG